jgi:hypothetical protein
VIITVSPGASAFSIRAFSAPCASGRPDQWASIPVTMAHPVSFRSRL